MKLALPVFGTLVLLLASCRALHSESADISLQVAGGGGSLGSEGWSSFGPVTALQASIAVEPHDWFCGIEAGTQFSGASGTEAGDDLDVDISELWIGAVHSWKTSSWLRLQAGAGLRYAEAEALWPNGLPYSTDSDSDPSLGAYAHFGAFANMGGSFSIGIDLRWADGEDYMLRGLSRDALLTQWLLCLRWDL